MDEDLNKKIGILIHLANADEEFDIKEKAFIYNVCLRKGINLDSIGDMIENPAPIGDLQHLNTETRLEYMTECMLLMLVDGKVLPKEVDFCINIGKQLGFKEEALNLIIDEIRDQMNITYGELNIRLSKLFDFKV